MTVARKLQASAGQQMDELWRLMDAMNDQMEELQRRFPASETEPMAVSDRVIIATCRRVLRKVRGLPMAPHLRQEVSGAYALASARMGVEE